MSAMHFISHRSPIIPELKHKKIVNKKIKYGKSTENWKKQFFQKGNQINIMIRSNNSGKM